MKKNIFTKFIIGSMFAFPLLSLAADATTQTVCKAQNFTSVNGIVNWASCTLMSTVIPFLFAIATAAFIWGVISYYLNPDNEEKRKKGKSFIIGGLIALFVMTSMWGIVKIFSGTFDLTTTIPSLDVN